MKGTYKKGADPEEEFEVSGLVHKVNAHFEEDIYQLLPEAIKALLSIANSKQERDVILLGSLSVISGCLPNVRGVYDNRWVYPNLYAFIDAPAGAGKGVLNFVRYLADPIHKAKREESRQMQLEYEQKKQEQKRQKEADSTELVQPPNKMLLIPANNSASSFVQTLSDNDGSGILFSTEADTLTNSLAQDWGNFSDVLRCAFHHEPVEIQRRTNREYISLDAPRLSVMLTGTQGQLQRLIPDTENGLFSRFMYYTMKSVPVFRNVFERRGTVPGQEFHELGQQLLLAYRQLAQLEEAVECQLDSRFQDFFFTYFNSLLKSSYSDTGERILATVHRIGLITYRISMVLACVRVFIDDRKQPSRELHIQEVDFQTAIHLSKHLLFQSMVHIADMPGNKKESQSHRRFNHFVEKLPGSFSRQEAAKIATKLKIPASTLTRYLVKGPFERTEHGHYRKMATIQGHEQMDK